MINRELPFIKESHETSDHPHHQSLFLGYGNVSGLDFWSTAHGERIVYRATLETRSGDTGELDFAADWQDPQGRAVLREFRRVTFGSTEDSRWMDHDITLQALDEALNFNDTKEGMLGLRLADALREEGGTGRYQDAFGREGSAEVWEALSLGRTAGGARGKAGHRCHLRTSEYEWSSLLLACPGLWAVCRESFREKGLRARSPASGPPPGAGAEFSFSLANLDLRGKGGEGKAGQRL